MQSRQLRFLVGNIGLSYFRRLLPPVWLPIATLACGALWLNASDELLAPLTGGIAALAAAVLLRDRARTPGLWKWLWPALLMALAVLAELDVGWFRSHAAEILIAVPAAAYLLSALAYLAGSAGLCIRLERYARTLDEDSLLRMLPPEAAHDARRWLAGDDSKARELALVVHLAALMKALHAVNPRAAARARCAM